MTKPDLGARVTFAGATLDLEELGWEADRGLGRFDVTSSGDIEFVPNGVSEDFSITIEGGDTWRGRAFVSSVEWKRVPIWRWLPWPTRKVAVTTFVLSAPFRHEEG